MKKTVEKELDQAQAQFDQFENQCKDLTLDRMNEAPKQEAESQLKMSQNEIDKHNHLYLKPKRTISSKEKFNEKYREAYEYAKQYVNFSAQNNEIIGEDLDFWTKPFAGMPAEEWIIPVGKPVWAPRYVAEQISRCKYHRLTMKDSVANSSDGMGTYYGQMVVDKTINRLDAEPITERKHVFMGSKAF